MQVMTSSSLIDDISDELLACRICLEPLRRPKTLTCRHTFCELCLERLRDRQLSPAGDDDDTRRRPSAVSRRSPVCLTCPVCYDSCPLPPGGVSRLPDDPVVTQLRSVVERRRSATQRSDSEVTCQICSASATVGGDVRPRRRSANVKCVDCDKFMCSPCARLHRRTNVRTSWRLLVITNVSHNAVICIRSSTYTPSHSTLISRLVCSSSSFALLTASIYNLATIARLITGCYVNDDWPCQLEMAHFDLIQNRHHSTDRHEISYWRILHLYQIGTIHSRGSFCTNV